MRVLSRLWMRPAGVAMEMVAVVSARRVAVTTDRHRPTANPNLRTNCRRSRNRNNRDLASVSARIQQSNADTAIKIQRQREREREREFYSQLHCRHTRTAISPSKLVPLLSNTYNERYTKENIHRQRRNRQYGKNKQMKKKTNCVHIQ